MNVEQAGVAYSLLLLLMMMMGNDVCQVHISQGVDNADVGVILNFTKWVKL
jgi:hypothetical protein